MSSTASYNTRSNHGSALRGDFKDDRMNPMVGGPQRLTPEMFGLNRSQKEDNQCSQLATRIVGTVSLFMGLLLMAVAAIIGSTACCGSHYSYDEDEWNKECNSGSGAEDSEFFSSDSNGSHSCYHRNITALVTVLFAILLLGVGFTIVLIGECVYDVNEEKDEQKLENFARYMKAREQEMQQMEKQQRREEKLARSEAARSEMSDRERTERLNNMRRYSIGNPQTPSDRHVEAMYGQRAHQPQVVQSHPYVYGNSRPYAVV